MKRLSNVVSKKYAGYKMMFTGLIFIIVQTLLFPHYVMSVSEVVYWVLGMSGGVIIIVGLFIVLYSHGNIYFQGKKLRFRIQVKQ